MQSLKALLQRIQEQEHKLTQMALELKKKEKEIQDKAKELKSKENELQAKIEQHEKHIQNLELGHEIVFFFGALANRTC
ncbi:hypothetical protein ACFBA1_001905 [Campylobacter coli]